MKCLKYFKALSDITRLRIFNILQDNELSVNEIVKVLEMGQSRISRHLKIMSDSGLLSCRRNGVQAFYYAENNFKSNKFSECLKDFFTGETILMTDLSETKKIVSERREKSRIFFHDNAHRWDKIRHEIIGDFKLNDCIAVMAGHPEVSVDLGCGTGALLEKLHEVSRYTIGIDSSHKMIEKAKSRFTNDIDNTELRLGELEHLPMGNDEADFGVISLALHHVNKPEAAISEAFRVLKNNGKLVVAEFDKHHQEKIAEECGDIWFGFSKNEMEQTLLACGFRVNTISENPLSASPLKIIIYSAIKQNN